MKTLRAAIYGRVSTDEQDPEAQLREVREFVARRAWSAVEYIDHASGRKESRPELDRLWKDVRRGRVDVVVVWKFDRFARTLRQLVLALDEFRELGVDFVSVTQAIDTTTALGRAMFAVAGAFAEFEVETIRERVRSGVAKAKASGKTLGRPKVTIDEGRVLELRRQGRSLREISVEVGVSKTVLARFLSSCPENVGAITTG
jgi:DNA invertase Pin-like site-specific DNA recombinase